MITSVVTESEIDIEGEGYTYTLLIILAGLQAVRLACFQITSLRSRSMPSKPIATSPLAPQNHVTQKISHIAPQTPALKVFHSRPQSIPPPAPIPSHLAPNMPSLARNLTPQPFQIAPNDITNFILAAYQVRQNHPISTQKLPTLCSAQSHLTPLFHMALTQSANFKSHSTRNIHQPTNISAQNIITRMC